MAISRSTMALAATTLLLAAMTAVEGAGKAAPAPVDCTSVVLSMADCLSYVTNGSNVEKPEGSCCSGLKSVLKSAPECLCQSFKNSAQFGVVLNVTKALSLPAACHVHTPSLSSCGLSLSPAGAPAGAVVSPAGAPSSPMAGAPSMGISGAMAPASAPAGAKTGASSTIGISVELIIAAIATAFFSSF